MVAKDGADQACDKVVRCYAKLLLGIVHAAAEKDRAFTVRAGFEEGAEFRCYASFPVGRKGEIGVFANRFGLGNCKTVQHVEGQAYSGVDEVRIAPSGVMDGLAGRLGRIAEDVLEFKRAEQGIFHALLLGEWPDFVGQSGSRPEKEAG